jgi:DTW domain-containing protein YfiP
MEIRDKSLTPLGRLYCRTCVRPGVHCYCGQIRRFDPRAQFVILIHPIEQRRQIATGRMAHLSLENSILIPGDDYSQDAQVNRLIADAKNHCVILFPGPAAANLTALTESARADLFPVAKKLVIFVIDGTWNTARKTMHLSEILKQLPRICFSPSVPSQFQVRRQPAPECYSTIEAIHHTIELLAPSLGLPARDRSHDQLLKTFKWMVDTQLAAYAVTPVLRRVRATRHGSFTDKKPGEK